METRFSIRTRILDYIWARLPILVSEGDVTSQWVEKYQIGRVVPPKSPDRVAKELIALLSTSKGEWSPAFEKLHMKLNWFKIVEPLRKYCFEGTHAPDKQFIKNKGIGKSGTSIWRSRWGRARFIWRTQGFLPLLVKIARQLRTNLAKML